ncbi:MAG: DnaB-like helicase C-terminal domain-containing protein [Terrisporobacter sp.]|uniref:replicative DNA helicase n=1 Tax=Terrisporobacter sp. TaxID=1965305 RepID=UPI002FCA11E9
MDKKNNLVSNVEAEQSVLGSIMLDSSAIEEVEPILESSMFSYQAHEIIFDLMLELHKKNEPIDLITIVEELRKQVHLEDVGGVAYITSLFTIVPTTSNILYYANIVLGKYKNRKIIDKFNKFKRGEIDDTTLVYQLENDINLANQKLVKKDTSMASIAARAFDYINSEAEDGIRLGIPMLDDVIGGLYDGELTTIAAKSGGGKTALALQILRNVISQSKKVLFISGEMTDIQILFRNISAITGVAIKKMKDRNLDEKEMRAYINALASLSQGNYLHINDNTYTISGIKREIKRLNPDLVIIDYLQILEHEGKETGEAKYAELSRKIKKMTIDFNLPIIQLAQLNDEMKDERPKGDRPMRSSKQIYMDSNNVIYIHRPNDTEVSKYCKLIGFDSVEDVRKKEQGIGMNLAEIIVAKNRDGEASHTPHWYVGSRLTFKKCQGAKI